MGLYTNSWYYYSLPVHDVDTCTAMQKTNYICIFVVFTTSRFYIMYSASERASRCQLGWQAAILPLDHERAWGMRMRSPGIEPGSAANCI